MVESGIFDKFKRDYVDKGSHCYTEVKNLAEDEVKTLSLPKMQTTFYLLVLGKYLTR